MSYISKTTIDKDTPTVKKCELTLKVSLHSLEDIPAKQLQTMLQHVLHDWNDGRYPFDVEMFKHGLNKCMLNALMSVIEKEAQDEFGHEKVVSHGGRQHTARWYIEAQKRYAEASEPWTQDDWEVTITPSEEYNALQS